MTIVMKGMYSKLRCKIKLETGEGNTFKIYNQVLIKGIKLRMYKRNGKGKQDV